MTSAGFVAALWATDIPAVVILDGLLIDGKHVLRRFDNLPAERMKARSSMGTLG